jgi:hypothetical protein
VQNLLSIVPQLMTAKALIKDSLPCDYRLCLPPTHCGAAYGLPCNRCSTATAWNSALR